MKIALIGFRGIPVIYSGFETFAEKLAVELVKRGHQVTVYCRRAYIKRGKKRYKGVRLVTLPTIKNKNLETFSHSLLSTTHACISRKYNFIYYLGVGNTIFAILPRIFGIKTAVNVDGLDWKRKKWGTIAKLYLGISEYLATVIPNKIITDSTFMQRYFEKKYAKKPSLISYGYFEPSQNNPIAVLKKYGLEKKKYLVWVGRLVAENRVEELISAFSQIKSSFKCVIIGDNPYDSTYKRKIYQLADNDKRIVFTGFLDRKHYATIVKNSYAYIETKRSGGAHPSLIEAMGFGCLILSNNHLANKEVLGKSAIYYQIAKAERNLANKIKEILLPEFKKRSISLRSLTKKRAQDFFNWEKIITTYEQLFESLVTQSSPPHNHQNQNYL